MATPPSSKPSTVEAYLAALPADRRAALLAVRAVILENLDSDCEEGMQYGMIGYYVPHRVNPPGYHCDASLRRVRLAEGMHVPVSHVHI